MENIHHGGASEDEPEDESEARHYNVGEIYFLFYCSLLVEMTKSWSIQLWKNNVQI